MGALTFLITPASHEAVRPSWENLVILRQTHGAYLPGHVDPLCQVDQGDVIGYNVALGVDEAGVG